MNAPFTTPIRTAPHNIEAEQALLGAILVNNEAFYRVSDFLEPKHFFEPIHQRIFELASELIRAGKLETPVTLKTFMAADLDIAGLTVNQYLARLAAEATTIINAEDYGRTIYDLSIRRGLIIIGEDMVNLAYEAPVDATPLSQIEEGERQLYELAESGRNDPGFQRFGQALAAAVDMAGRAYLRDGKLSGLATGLPALDADMGGLQPSDLIILAGRPGMGKTALATNIAYNVAKAWRDERRADGHRATLDGGIVGFFSLEMSAEQLATRIIGEQTAIPANKIRRGAFKEGDYEKIKQTSTELQNLPLYVDQTGGLSIGQLTARARQIEN
jgi:replicative DNA helicase